MTYREGILHQQTEQKRLLKEYIKSGVAKAQEAFGDMPIDGVRVPPRQQLAEYMAMRDDPAAWGLKYQERWTIHTAAGKPLADQLAWAELQHYASQMEKLRTREAANGHA